MRINPGKLITLKEYLEAKHNPDRFAELADGWIADRFLCCDWSPVSLEKRMIRWKAAEEYAAKYGRQADDVEMETLIDRSQYGPSLIKAAKILGLDVRSWYWTGRRVVGQLSYVLCAVFYSGNILSGHERDSHIVRPIRPSVLKI